MLCRSYYPDVSEDPYTDRISSAAIVNYNIDQLRLCRDCIKHCYSQINRDLKGIKDALMEIKRTPKTMRRVAAVCRVDGLTQPWECYTKIARLRNLNIKPHVEVEYEKKGRDIMKDKQQKQKKKYEKFIKQQKELDLKEERDKEETNLLFDKLGNKFRKLPSLVSKDTSIKEKRS